MGHNFWEIWFCPNMTPDWSHLTSAPQLKLSEVEQDNHEGLFDLFMSYNLFKVKADATLG